MIDVKTKIFRSLQIFHFFNDGLVLLFPILMVTYFEKFNLIWYQTGLIFSMNTLMIVVFQILNGYLVDKGYIKQIMVIGMIGVTISGYLLHFATDFYSLFVISIVAGIFFGFVHAINYTMTIHLYPNERNEKLAHQGFAGDSGKLLAIFISSVLIIFYNEVLAVIYWNVVSTICTIIALYMILQIQFEDYFSSDNVENIPTIKKNEKNHNWEMNYKPIITLFSLLFLFNAYFDVVGKNMATFLFDTRTGILRDYSEIIYSIIMFAGTLGTYNAGKIRNKLGLKLHLMIAYFIMILTLLVFVLTNSNSFIVVLALLCPNFFFMLTIYTNLFGPVSERIKSKRLGLSMGLLLGLGWLGGFTGTWIGGKIADINPNLLIWFGIIICIVSMIIILTMDRKRYEK